MTTQSPTNHADEPDVGLWGRTLAGDTAALRTLGLRFWPPIYMWWRRAGLGPKKAVIATEACFERWLGKEPPLDSHPGSLRMRDWVLAQLNDLATRGVKLLGAPPLEIDWETAARRYDQEPDLPIDDLFQRRWALTVFEHVSATIRAEYSAAGHTVRLTWLLPFLHVREVDEAQFSAVTARTGIGFGAVRVAVAEFRKRHRYLVRMAVADTVATQAEIDSEHTALLCNSAIGVEGEAAAIIQIAGPPTVVPTRNPNTTGIWKWEPPSLAAAARLFPNYEILEMIGRGGMGVVYKAQQTALDRVVAIKLLPLEVSANSAFAERFEREAKTLAKLNHPNIVAVYDFGKTSGGHLFFVMEFIHGTNLWHLIHGVGIEPTQALEILSGVCDALQYAHAKGVVHRDVKPANVLLDTEGRIKVADFGLARMNSTPGGPAFSGPVMGTPEYMAPEHLRDVNVDHRADVFSLGVMLYEMLCREIPKGAFDLPSRRTTVDPRVDAVVIRAMQHVPDRRYQTAGEMKYAVEAIRTGPATSLPTPRPAAAPLPVPRSLLPPERKESSGIGWFVAFFCAIAAAIAAFVYYNPGKIGSLLGNTPPAPTPAPANPPKRDARDDFAVVTFANAKYQLVSGAVSWIEAKSRAEKRGGHLATIETVAEDEFLRNSYSAALATPGQFIQFGAYRPSAGSDWQWVTDIEWKYAGWGAGEPAHADAQPTEMPVYAVLTRDTGKVEWKAKLASDETKPNFKDVCRGFLIEWNLTPTPPPTPPNPASDPIAKTNPPVPVPAPAPQPAPPPPVVPPTPPPSEFAVWLAARNAEWQSAYERDVLGPYKKGLEEVRAQYLALLDRQFAAASKANNLEIAVGIRNEQQRINSGGEIPAEDEAIISDAVKKMRAEVRPRITKLERERDARAKTLYTQYDQFLLKHQTAQTTSGKVVEGQLVKNLRDEIANTWVKPATPSNPSAPAPPGPNPPKTVVQRAPKIQKRKLVEQLLARNAMVTVREKGNKTPVELKSSSGLADDDFQITIVHFRLPVDKPAWTEDDNALLDNVIEVPEIGFFNVALTDAVLDRIRGCREITALRLANLGSLTPASAQCLATLGGLQTLSLNNIPWPAEALKGIAQLRKIDNVEIENMALSDDAFAAICTLPALERIELAGTIRDLTENGWQALGNARRLKSIELSGGDITAKIATQIARATSLESIKIIARPVTDADIQPFGALTRLRALDLDRTNVSGTGFGAWPPRPSVHSLNLQGAGRVDDASLKAICAAFPKLETLEFTANKGQMTPAGAVHLGHLRQIKTLRIHGDSVTNECAVEIAKADSLEELDVGSSLISEAGLTAMSKMDRLTRLRLYSPVLSEAAFKALGKFRGLKDITVGSSVTDENVRKMKDALPGVNVRH